MRLLFWDLQQGMNWLRTKKNDYALINSVYIYIQMTTPFVNSVHTNDYALVNSVHTNDYALVSSVHTNDYALVNSVHTNDYALVSSVHTNDYSFVNSVHTNDYAFVNSVHTNDYALVSSVHTNDYAFVNSVHTTIFLILVLHNNTVQSIPQRSRYWHPREVRMKGTQEKKENTKFKMVSEREDKET